MDCPKIILLVLKSTCVFDITENLNGEERNGREGKLEAGFEKFGKCFMDTYYAMKHIGREIKEKKYNKIYDVIWRQRYRGKWENVDKLCLK